MKKLALIGFLFTIISCNTSTPAENSATSDTLKKDSVVVDSVKIIPKDTTK